MTGLLWGLLGAVLIGGADCTARVTSQRVSLLPLIFCVMAISTVLLTIALLATGNMPVWHTGAWFVSALSGALNVAALLFLYKALAYGPVSVASPAASSFAVFLVLLNALAGEPWTAYQALAVVMVFVGIVMLSVKSDKQNSNKSAEHQYSKKWLRRTSLLATGAALTISFRMFFAQEATAELGPVSALYLNRLFALITCALAIILMPVIARSNDKPTDEKNQWPTHDIKWFVLLQGLLEMAAFAAFLYGSEGDGRVAATIGFSTFAAATTLIAWIALKEPIGWWRGLWIVFICIGVMIASVG